MRVVPINGQPKGLTKTSTCCHHRNGVRATALSRKLGQGSTVEDLQDLGYTNGRDMACSVKAAGLPNGFPRIQPDPSGEFGSKAGFRRH